MELLLDKVAQPRIIVLSPATRVLSADKKGLQERSSSGRRIYAYSEIVKLAPLLGTRSRPFKIIKC
jgi:hypothetical protein